MIFSDKHNNKTQKKNKNIIFMYTKPKKKMEKKQTAA